MSQPTNSTLSNPVSQPGNQTQQPNSQLIIFHNYLTFLVMTSTVICIKKFLQIDRNETFSSTQ
jgi:hypothetical protein